MRKYIVKPTTDAGFPTYSVWMRCGPGARNLVQLAICPCGHARKLAKVLNEARRDVGALPIGLYHAVMKLEQL